jgi:hypothetical protein
VNIPKITRTTITRKDGEYHVKAYIIRGDREVRYPSADYFTDSKTDAELTARSITKHVGIAMNIAPTATLREEIDTLAKLEGMQKEYGLDVIVGMLMTQTQSDYSDILASVARNLVLLAGKEIRDNPGFAGCLLRDAARVLDAVYKMEN